MHVVYLVQKIAAYVKHVKAKILYTSREKSIRSRKREELLKSIGLFCLGRNFIVILNIFINLTFSLQALGRQ